MIARGPPAVLGPALFPDQGTNMTAPKSSSSYCVSLVRAWLLALQAAGVPFNASWLTWQFNSDAALEPTQDEWEEHSDRCSREAAEADITLFVAQDGENHFGALLEVGAALSAGKRVFLVSPHEWPFLRCNPRCRSFETLADAVTAIMAGVAGERARREMQAAA
jgi:hypothetical protein